MERRDSPLRSPLVFALVLGSVLWGVILWMNMLGEAEIRVSAAQFRKLEERDLLERIEIAPEGLHCRLSREIRVSGRNREEPVRRVFLDSSEAAGLAGGTERWRKAGIRVVQVEGKKGGEWGGTVILVVLIGVGVWNLWAQIQKDRIGGGSPRRRLQELKDAFRSGEIDELEYQRRAESIWSEM